MHDQNDNAMYCQKNPLCIDLTLLLYKVDTEEENCFTKACRAENSILYPGYAWLVSDQPPPMQSSQ